MGGEEATHNGMGIDELRDAIGELGDDYGFAALKPGNADFSEMDAQSGDTISLDEFKEFVLEFEVRKKTPIGDIGHRIENSKIGTVRFHAI